MEGMTPFKSPILFAIAVAISLTVCSQDYSNIEFIENKGQWDSRVKFKGEVNAGAIFVTSTGFTVLQHNREEFEELKVWTHGRGKTPPATAARPDGKFVLHSHSYNIDFVAAFSYIALVDAEILT